MKRTLSTILFIGIGISALSQSKTILRGPFDVSDLRLPAAIYGANNRLFVSSYGGVWYTDDRESWVQSGYLHMDGIESLMKDENGNLYATNSGFLYKSADNGESWNFLFFSLFDDVTKLPVFSYKYAYGVSGNTVFVASQNGLGYFLLDKPYQGVHFNQFAGKNIIEIEADGNDVVAVDIEGTMHVSHDLGATWTTKTFPFSYFEYSSITLKGGNIFAGSYQMWYTENFGDDWEIRNDGYLGLIRDFAWVDDKVYAVGNGPFVFSEEDNEWKELDGTTPSYAVAASGDHVFAASPGVDPLEPGRFRESSDGGDTWESVSLNGYTGTQILDMQVDPVDSTIYAVGDRTFYKKAKGASIFERFIGEVLGAFLLDGDFIYASTATGFTKYDKVTGNMIESLSVDNDIPVRTIVKDGTDLFIATVNSGIVRVDDSDTATPFNAGLPNLQTSDLQISGGKLYALSNGLLYATPTDAPDWQQVDITVDMGAPAYFIVNGNTIIVTGQNSAMSRDGGATWNIMNSPPYMSKVRYSNGLYYAIGDGLINISYDEGETWLGKMAGAGRPLIPVSIMPTIDSVYFGAIGKGVWSFKRLKLQKITFNEVDPPTVGDAPFALTASSSEGLTVSYKTLADEMTISGNMVTIVKAGYVQVEARQGGTSTIDEAVPVYRNFCINPAQPVITSGTTNDVVTLTSSNDAGNQWYFEDELIEGATGETLVITGEGEYTVNTTIETCESETSEVFTYEIPIPEPPITGLNEPGSEIGMFPNPAHDKINVVTPRQSRIELVDPYGSVFDTRVSTGSDEFNLRSLSSGVYLFKINTNGNLVVRKFLKQ